MERELGGEKEEGKGAVKEGRGGRGEGVMEGRRQGWVGGGEGRK